MDVRNNKTLWAYGCSWTYSDVHRDALNFKFWPEIAADYLQIRSINRGWGGESISQATIKLMRDLPRIKKDDIVVFQFSYPERLCFPYMERKDYHKFWYGHDIKINYGEGRTIKNDFFKQKRMMTYLDFILSFRTELLLTNFYSVVPIFDYIENNIGAKVKYWFLKVAWQEDADHINFLEDELFDENRIVLFPTKKTSLMLFEENIEAEQLIYNEELRISDSYLELDWKNTKWVMDDGHPSQKGQGAIAKNIINSIDNAIDTSNLNVVKRKKRLI